MRQQIASVPWKPFLCLIVGGVVYSNLLTSLLSPNDVTTPAVLTGSPPRPAAPPARRVWIRPETKPEIKPETKLETKPEIKPEIKPETKPRAEAAESRPTLDTLGGAPPKIDPVLFLRWSERGPESNHLVTLTFANAEYLRNGLVLNLLCSWARLGHTSYVVVAVDAVAATQLRDMGYGSRLHWDPVYWAGTSGGILRGSFNTTVAYLHFIQRRTRFVSGLLHAAPQLDLVVTDGDTVWLHDPVVAAGVGLTPRCDVYSVNDEESGGPGAERQMPVGGFLIIRNNARSRHLYKVWTATEKCLRSREQPALHGALRLMDARMALAGQHREHSAQAGDRQVVFCMLPAQLFPTSAHLAMKPGPKGPDSQYLRDYGYRDPRALPTVVVAHSNLKWKANKVLWLRQFGWWMVAADRQSCSPGPPRTSMPEVSIPIPIELPPPPRPLRVEFENAVGKQIVFSIGPAGLSYTVDGEYRPPLKEIFLDKQRDGRYMLHFPSIQKTAGIPPERTLEVVSGLKAMADEAGTPHNIQRWLKPNPKSVDSLRFVDHVGFLWIHNRSIKPQGGHYRFDMPGFLTFHHSPGDKWERCAAVLDSLALMRGV
eukprot:Hpha_TRINITY_DN15114_c4_g8::TRINITY_DN15114_c4_g8_i1::g.127094::m.127094